MAPILLGGYMVFKGQPNQYVRFANKTVIRLTNKKGLYFDENGLYETENKLLIKVLSQHFESVKEENNVISEDIKAYKCKQCDFESDNMGKLLAHIRKEHKKEG
jgi:hypothetical protein